MLTAEAQDWQNILTAVFGTVLTVGSTAAAIYLISWLKVKKQEVLENVKNETVKKYLNLLDATIAECVLATNQTYVNTLKSEGIFTADAQKEAFQRTYDAVTSIITDDAQAYLTDAVKDLNTYITTKIEANIAASK